MANAFSKEERVAFEDLLAGFQDALVLSRNVSIYRTEGQMMERARDTIWRPMPYIAQSISSTPGTAISGYQDMTQLSVPATLGFSRTVPWTMTTLQLRDALQEGRLGDAAKQKLASDINEAILNVASAQGTLVVPIGAPAGTFDDVERSHPERRKRAGHSGGSDRRPRWHVRRRRPVRCADERAGRADGRSLPGAVQPRLQRPGRQPRWRYRGISVRQRSFVLW